MKRATIVLYCLPLLCGACRPQQMELTIVLGDAGCPPVNLKCVNFLQFSSGFSTHCIQLTEGETLDTLCDLQKVANGQELFKLSPDTELIIEMKGLHVYPATSCDYDVTCPPRIVFKGSTGSQSVRVGDLAGGAVPLQVVMVAPCPAGSEQWYRPPRPDEPCSAVCYPGEVECDGVQGGCLCFSPTSTHDAGR